MGIKNYCMGMIPKSLPLATILMIFMVGFLLPQLLPGDSKATIDNVQNKIELTKNLVIVLPADCLQVLSASDGKNGLLVTYKSAVCDKTRAALYPNANDGDKPSFIFTFVKE